MFFKQNVAIFDSKCERYDYKAVNKTGKKLLELDRLLHKHPIFELGLLCKLSKLFVVILLSKGVNTMWK